MGCYPVLKEGDLIKVTSLWSGSDKEMSDNYLDGEAPTFGFVETAIGDDGKNGAHVDWVFEQYDVGVSPSIDEYEVVPEDEWPDEVHVAIAKRALLRDDDE